MPLARLLTSGHTDLEKDTDLAIFIVDYFDAGRNTVTGAWPGERETRRLQNTCHIIESVSELGLGQFSDRLIDPAVKWLTDLPLLRQVLQQDRHSVRIYPVRFKSLAALNHFDADRLRADFNSLCNYANTRTGFLHDVPGDFKSALVTMIWLDTLLSLREVNSNESTWLARLDPGLDAISAALFKWLDEGGVDGFGPGRPLEITNAGDASYALDLLLRSNRLTIVSPEVERAMNALLHAVNIRNLADPGKRALYSCLILSRYFSHLPQVQTAVTDLLRDVRTRYEAGAQGDHPDYYHAIILRLLAAHHKAALRDSIFETLWLRNRQAAAREVDGAEQQQRSALTQLIHQHIQVNLGRVRRLSGTRTHGVVYRVQFSLQSEATDRDGHPFAIVPNSLQFIVKQGSIESLSRTIRRFGELPAELRGYFAHHSDKAENAGDDWYLLMEDLVGLTPLSEVLDRIDLRWAGRAEHDQMARLTAAVSSTLRALHQHNRHAPVATNELGWLYLNPIAQSVNTLCEAGAFPELKAYIEQGFTANGRAYQPLNHYLAKLQQHADRLTTPAVGGVHGDCHSRNLMIDDALKVVKFVDLETLSYTDDYLTDYGLLFEDVALYRYLPRGQRPDALTTNDIDAEAASVTYPPIPRAADSVLYFQTCLLDQISTFAQTVGDVHYKPRLWLAIARNLVQLIARQLPLTDPLRRPELLKLSAVAYAETARLLSELVDHLESPDNARLPMLPFQGTSSKI
jgi:Phosphotransferase enzyme family